MIRLFEDLFKDLFNSVSVSERDPRPGREVLCERVSGGGGGETEGGEPPAEDQLLTSDQYHSAYYGMWGESANLSHDCACFRCEGGCEHVRLKPNTQNQLFKTRYFTPSDGHVPVCLFHVFINRKDVV